MIIIVLGGIGSGKTLFSVRSIVKKGQFAYTNFPLKNIKNYQRLRYSDIIKKDDAGKDVLNWGFWDDAMQKHSDFSIYLDEIHNVIHARASMTRRNQLMSRWVSQIRKILQDSPRNHLYCISQTIRKIDVDFRELAHGVITCQKAIKKGKVIIRLRFFDGVDNYCMGMKSKTMFFVGNPYFKFYDYLKIVRFSEEEEFI